MRRTILAAAISMLALTPAAAGSFSDPGVGYPNEWERLASLRCERGGETFVFSAHMRTEMGADGATLRAVSRILRNDELVLQTSGLVIGRVPIGASLEVGRGGNVQTFDLLTVSEKDPDVLSAQESALGTNPAELKKCFAETLTKQ